MSAPRPPEPPRRYGALAFAWAVTIWASSPLVPLVRARFDRPGALGFDLVVQLGLAVAVVVVAGLALAPGQRRRSIGKRLGGLAALLLAGGIAAIVLAPPDPRSRVIELAHFVQFGALGGLVFRAQGRRLSLAHAAVKSLLLVLAAGLVDEFLQHSLASRYGEARDVALNVVAGGLGAGCAFVLASSPPLVGPARGEEESSPRAWRLTLSIAMVLVAALGLFLAEVHGAYWIRWRSIEFVSRFREDELDREREERLARWRDLDEVERQFLLRPDRSFLRLKDFYASEARVHVQARNDAAERGDEVRAAFENALLERWFDPFLDATGSRRADLGARPAGSYRSPVLAHLWPSLTGGRLWILVAGLEIALVGAILFTMRIRTALVALVASLGLPPAVPSLGTAVAATPQMGEAEMAEALDQLGEMLGLPPVSPDELKRRVAGLGGLSFQSEVPVNFMSRDELATYIRDLFEEEYPSDYAEREETMLRGFGFLRPEQDLRALRETVLNENIAGFYDERPGVKKLFAISSGRSLNVLNQLILSHELRHALQDQHVVIRDKLQVESDYDDRRLAALCLFEGDASVLMEQYLASGATQNQPELASLFQVFSQSLSGEEIAAMFAGPALKEAPPVVQEQLIAPYFEGRKLAIAIFEKGGFSLLNEKLRRPPRSMEQVLHPSKYLDGSDEPVAVVLPEASGSKPVFEGTLGEFLIRVLLRGGPASGSAEAAAGGWGGDRYAILDNGGNGSYRLLWRSVWDTEADAREFASALRSYVQSRFASENNPVRLEGREVTFERRQFR